MIAVTRERETYLSHFAQAFPADGPSWLHGIREAAIARFTDLGFPTTRQEEWRLTNVAPIASVLFKPAVPVDLAPSAIAELDGTSVGDWPCQRLVFVNGRYSARLSSGRPLPAGVTVGSLATALRDESAEVEPHLARYAGYADHAFRALNTAFIEDGAFVHVPGGQLLEAPIHLLFVSTASGEAAVSHPRNLIVIGAGSRATVVESYLGVGRDVYFTNAVTELVVGENAVIDHYKVQRESEAAFHVATLQVRQDRSSTVVSHSISLGGALVRNDLTVVLDAEGSECTLNGLYVATGRQHVDHHTTIDHAKPHCTSAELYKGILGGRAKGVFNGRIIVRPDAQKSDAKQTNKNLLLSDDAVIDTKPALEIFCNDVKCTHGATLGQLDRDTLFYLRSRGIADEAARRLLIQAFASDIIDRITLEPIRTTLGELTLGRLSTA